MKIERTVGTGSQTVYVYYFPSMQTDERWPHKIGRAKIDAIKRIKSQQASMLEEPVIALFFKCDDASIIERIAHHALASRRMVTHGREWFDTNGDEVLSLLQCAPVVLTLGDQFRSERLRQRLSQTELAERANVRQATISKVERGEGDNSLIVLQQIAKALGKTIVLA